MDKFKKQIQQRLIANVISETLAQNEYTIFRDAWCTQERVLRFTTPFFRKLLPLSDSQGKWGTGDSVLFEVNNRIDSFTVDCVMSLASSTADRIANGKKLLQAAGIQDAAPEAVLESWDLTRADGDANKLFEDFETLISETIPQFEEALAERMDADLDKLMEGSAGTVSLNQYERNPKARAACLAAHGTACKVCGFDFGKAYGPEFAGKIEVHHIVPLSEIGEEYVVDPIKDLVPVCPNCHMALHSKKDGVYTVAELIAKRQAAFHKKNIKIGDEKLE